MLLNMIDKIVLSLYGLFLLAGLILLVYLIFRRLRIKKTEKFEDRDN